MRYEVIPLLRCPVCAHPNLKHSTFKEATPEVICDGVIWCQYCANWFPIQDTLLDFLTGKLIYSVDRDNFWRRNKKNLQKIGLKNDPMAVASDTDLQKAQQSHFDWYANNHVQSYKQYQQQVFWRAADWMTFTPWLKSIKPNGWLLDIGCAEGRSTFNFLNKKINVIGFDVSKQLVCQAIHRYKMANYPAKATFMLADASNLPFHDCSFDYVLIYGVLHHVADPVVTCKETARVLKISGTYFGSENNKTVFRVLFDFLQKRVPLWHEAAGPEALIDLGFVKHAFDNTGVEVKTHTSVFMLPHIINLLPYNLAKKALVVTDTIGRALPLINQNGGLIVINGIKTKRG